MRLNAPVLVALTALWLAALGAGQLWLLGYQSAVGAAAAPPADWPADSAIRPAAGRFTLLMFAHPHCPCTRASLDGLSWVMARAQDRVDAYVVFVVPPGAPDGWGRTDLCDAAEAVPGVRVVGDAGGLEAARFDAHTSGQTVLYGPGGRLLFRGGLTASRGHAGDSPGRRAVAAALAGREARCVRQPVFGCALLDADPDARKDR